MNRCILNQNTILFIARDVMAKYILFVIINEIINSLNFKNDWNGNKTILNYLYLLKYLYWIKQNLHNLPSGASNMNDNSFFDIVIHSNNFFFNCGTTFPIFFNPTHNMWALKAKFSNVGTFIKYTYCKMNKIKIKCMTSIHLY